MFFGWVRKLLDSSGNNSSVHEQESDTSDPIDWKAVEDLLVSLATERIGRFANEHRAETFYGLGFDCTADRGEVLICLNTDERRQNASDEDLGDQWGFGDWMYHAINYDDAWEEAWGEVELAIANASNILANNRKYPEMQLLSQTFLETASRALLRVAQSESVARLNRTADFQVLCVDHDEGPFEALARFEKLRANQAIYNYAQ